MKRTGGNRKRYETLLRKFAEQQAGAVETIRAAIAADDTPRPNASAHSIKGAAGNLGADALAQAAAKAESAVKTGQDVEIALDALSSSLDAAVNAIRIALPAEAVTNGAGEAAADPAAVIEPLTQLKKLLENDDGEAAEFISDVRSKLSGVLTRCGNRYAHRFDRQFRFRGRTKLSFAASPPASP